jgi:hypothetical protein
MKTIKNLLLILIFPCSIFAQKTSNIRYVYQKNVSLRVHFLKGGARIFAPKKDPTKLLATKKEVDFPAKIPKRYYLYLYGRARATRLDTTQHSLVSKFNSFIKIL